MHRIRWFLAGMAALALAGIAAAPAFALTIDGRSVTRTVAPPHAPGGRQQASGIGGGWTHVGPSQSPGRFHCVSADLLNQPVVGCGSDGVGYWWGYALSDFGMEERGREGGGIRQMTNRLHYPEVGAYYQPINTIRTDGSMWVTPDDGNTWQETVVDVPPGYSIGRVRQLGYDSGSINVAYALAYGTDDLDQNGALFLRSFDGGQTFEFSYFVPTTRAHLWTSRQGAGLILLAWLDGFDQVQIERNTMLGDGSAWEVAGVVGAPQSALDADTLLIVAQEHSDLDSVRVWVAAGAALYRSGDGGASFDYVRDLTPASDRSLGTSLLTPELLMWTEPNELAFWSPDGGATAHQIPVNPFGDAGTVHNSLGNIDCFKWNFATAATEFTVRRPSAGGGYASEKRQLPGAVKTRQPAGSLADGDAEWFYLSTGGGVYGWSPQDTTAFRLTGYGVITLQVNDVLPLRDAELQYSTLLATRDVGLLGIREWGPSAPGDVYWSSAITSFPLDIGHVVSCMQPTPADPIYFGDFRGGGVTMSGDGVFSGVGVLVSGYHHPAMVADPVGPYRFWIADNWLHRVTWNRAANTWTDEPIPSPIDEFGPLGVGFGIAPSNTSQWYLATADGRVWTSPDAGGEWFEGAVGPGIDDSGPLPIDPLYPYVTIAVNPADPLEAWMVGSTVIRTIDGGLNWTTQVGGLPLLTHGWDIAYDGTPAGNVYLAADAGPFRWNAGAGAWEDLAPAGGDVPNVPFRAVAAMPWQGGMRWGTWGRGVWDYSTGSSVGAPAPQRPSLALAASRNPVRDLARLDWTLSQPGHVKLELLDVAGRRVRTLHDGLETAGEHSSTLDVRGLGAGVYFAKLTTTQDHRSLRVVVVP